MSERTGSYIPNEPLGSSSKVGVSSALAAGEDGKKRRNSDGGASSSKSPGQSSGKKVSRSLSTPQSSTRVAQLGGSVSQTPGTPGMTTPGSEDGANSRKYKMWKSIMSNINRSVDELYYLCEDERDEFKCKEVMSFFSSAQAMILTNL